MKGEGRGFGRGGEKVGEVREECWGGDVRGKGWGSEGRGEG